MQRRGRGARYAEERTSQYGSFPSRGRGRGGGGRGRGRGQRPKYQNRGRGSAQTVTYVENYSGVGNEQYGTFPSRGRSDGYFARGRQRPEHTSRRRGSAETGACVGNYDVVRHEQYGRFPSRGRERGGGYLVRGGGERPEYPSRGRGSDETGAVVGNYGVAGNERDRNRRSENVGWGDPDRRALQTPISYKQLAELERTKTPQNIVIHLASSRSGLEERLEGYFTNELMLIAMCLKVFGKMAEADGPTQSLTRVLQIILKHKFPETIKSFLFTVKNERKPAQVVPHVENALKLMNSMITILPKDSYNEVALMMYFLGSVIGELGESAVEVQEYHNQVSANLEILKDKQKNKALRRASRKEDVDDLHSQPPPDDFRDISVFPQLSDINGEFLPFIRANLIDRSYENVDHYLDVQFRLLREDFMRPLREGIAEVRRNDNRQRKRFENVKVYEGVTVQFMKPGRQHGIVHRIQFNTENLQGVRWQNTKRLMHGNLLCLSSDLFKEDVILAVVIDRDTEDVAQGILTVRFVSENNCDDEEENDDIKEGECEDDECELGEEKLPRHAEKKTKEKILREKLDMKKIYTMVESDAYFESYRHILAALKETKSIPLERYIVHFLEYLHAPEYIRPSVTSREVCYDFSPVTKMGRRVKILHEDWPTPEELCLDPSQADAVKLALTKELAIIQGPPGTGKTHVGLIIMKLLLQNNLHWSRPSTRDAVKMRCPILVVCYTNHALDQFLEGIAKFAKKDQTIVRVGGRSKNEVAMAYSLKEIRMQRKKNGHRDSNPTIRHAIGELAAELRHIEEQWEAITTKLEASLRCLPSLRELRYFMPPSLYKQFNVNANGEKPQRESRDKGRGHEAPEMLEATEFENARTEILLLWLGINANSTVIQGDSQFGLENPEFRSSLKNNDYFEGEQETMERAADARSSSPKTDDDLEREEDTVESATDVQNQRMLDTDKISRSPDKRKSNEEKIHQSTKEIGAIAIKDLDDDDIGEEENQSDGEWKQQGQKRQHKKKMKFMIRGTETMTYAEECFILDIYELSQDDRWRLYRTWCNRWRQAISSGIDEEIETYNKLSRRLEEVRRQEDAEILQSAHVVAVTTTGAAKYRDLIYKLNSKIVVVEEAAEVLEAHIITAMPESTKHLILIGDHRQLKPSPTVYELARKYNLDTSLFERLIKKIEHVTLSRQHRMRPSIADLIRPHIYRNLEDHDSVLLRDDITGLEKPLYFLSHTVNEESVADGRSKKNQYEADFVVALCNYIITQGYKPEQVTILTMYTGQILAFRRKGRGRIPEGVRVTAVDNFQGEENDIILLSLVRSNHEAKIGFLAIQNRVCVALSRAKSALYCIGNMELLASKSEIWRTIIRGLRETESIGESLMLQCKHHPDRRTPVKCEQDFDKVPEGGCGQPCNTRLDCGHVCPKPCHPYDHSNHRCTKPCDRSIPCEMKHPCKKRCWQTCEPCPERVAKVMPNCGHVQPVLCQTPPEQVKCLEEISVVLLCGHQARTPCYQHENTNLSMCREKCHELLECGHPCKGSCFECFQGRLHVPCAKLCGQTFVCGHSCNACGESCPPCRSKCRTKCKHSECKKTCGEPCAVCREKCAWKCPHFKCMKKCSEPCDRPPCNRPCQKKLKCKHLCIGLCGEPCPTLCKICDKDKVEEIFSGYEFDENARFVQLEDCAHVFTYQYLDKWMDQEEERNEIKMKECPKCKAIIWRSTRYGRIVNILLGNLNEVKKKIWGDASQTRKDIKRLFGTALEKKMFNRYGSDIDNYDFEMQCLYKETQRKGFLSENDVFLFREKLERLHRLRELKQAGLKLQKICPRDINDLGFDLTRIRQWVRLRRTQSTDQEKCCFDRETKRIAEAMKYITAKRSCRTYDSSSDVSSVLNQLHTMLFENVEQYNETKEEAVLHLFEKVPTVYRNLGVFYEESELIPNPMDFAPKGRWYSCPEGHVYAISECDGTRATSVCPECEKEIDESSYQLLASNEMPSEIDSVAGGLDSDSFISSSEGSSISDETEIRSVYDSESNFNALEIADISEDDFDLLT